MPPRVDARGRRSVRTPSARHCQEATIIVAKLMGFTGHQLMVMLIKGSGKFYT